MKNQNSNSRRNFLGTLAAGATAGSLSMLSGPLMAMEALNIKKEALLSGEEWFKKIKGTHRVVFDGSTPHSGFPVLWTYVYYTTNNATNIPDEDMTAVCILRHSAIPFALGDSVWYQYELGKMFNITDNTTGKPSVRNNVYMPKDGDFPVAGVQGIKELQARGAMFGVCDLALKVYSGMAAEKLGMSAEKAYEDWKAAIQPGIEPMPSGVWALGMAQEHGCGYIFAGE